VFGGCEVLWARGPLLENLCPLEFIVIGSYIHSITVPLPTIYYLLCWGMRPISSLLLLNYPLDNIVTGSFVASISNGS